MKRPTAWALAAILLLAALLRLATLGSRSLWFDESDAVLDSVSFAGSLNIFRLFNPVVFYKIFLFYWRHLSPYMDEWLLRLPSAVFGTATVLLTYRLAAFLSRSSRAGLVAAFLLCISPLHIYYSQEAVSYALAGLLGCAAVYCALRLAEKPGPGYFIGYVVTAVAAVYTHPVMWFVFPAVYLPLLLRKERYPAVWFAGLLALFLCVFWFYPAIYGRNFLFARNHFCFQRSAGWIPLPHAGSLLYTLKDLCAGYNLPPLYYFPAALVFSAVTAAGLFSQKKTAAALLASLTVAPPLAIFIVARLTGISYYIDRYFSPFLPFFCITVAFGIRTIKCIRGRAAVLLLFVFFSGAGLFNYYRDILPLPREQKGITLRQDIRGPARFVAGLMKEGDAVFHTCRNTALPFEYYFDFHFRKGSDVFLDYPARLRNKQYIFGFLPPRELERGVYGYVLRGGQFQDEYVYSAPYPPVSPRVFLVYSAWNFQGESRPESYAIEWFDRHYIREDERHFQGVIVYVYREKER